MTRAAICFVTMLVLPIVAPGQSGNPPVFEAADVHVSPPKPNPTMTGGFVRSGRFEVRTVTMLDLISSAYGVERDKILAGPAWLDSDRFDITAKAAASTSNETAKLMLRALLGERFKLVIRNEERPIDVYVLTVGTDGLKMKQSAVDQTEGCLRQLQPSPAQGVASVIAMSCHAMTMASLANGLGTMAGSAYIDNAVIDQTGLAGAWDFDLKWTPRGQLAAAGSDGMSVFAAIERLGLKINLVKRPMPVIVVESVNRQPTANTPDVAQSLPAGPSEFEVADIKPSAPGTRQRRGNFQPGSRIDLQGFTLKDLVTLAWNIPGAMVAPGPKWLESDRFDIVAQAPRDAIGLGLDPLRAMLRTLLEDRFKLVTHTEEHPVEVYVLSLPKTQHKLKKADPSARSGCKVVTASSDPKVPFLGIGRSCENTTMSQLADRLQSFAPAYVNRPVVDVTGLDGGWDFTLTWSSRAAIEAPRTPASPQSTDQAASSTPDGRMTIFEAVDNQLGLKLELQKYPMPVLMIDHAEPKPAEN